MKTKTTQEEFNKMPYGTKTTSEVLSIVEHLNLRSYKLIKTPNTYGIYNYKQNFFIWKHNTKKVYIRLTLISEGWNDKTLFYWNLETSYKPFNYKWNHRENANTISEKFKGNDTDRYLNYFKNMVDIIK